MDQPTSDDTEGLSESASTDFLEGFIGEPEYARRRGVTLRTCQRDRQLRKAPPHIKLGRKIFYRVHTLRDWLLKNERLAVQTLDAPRNTHIKRKNSHGLRSPK